MGTPSEMVQTTTTSSYPPSGDSLLVRLVVGVLPLAEGGVDVAPDGGGLGAVEGVLLVVAGERLLVKDGAVAADEGPLHRLDHVAGIVLKKEKIRLPTLWTLEGSYSSTWIGRQTWNTWQLLSTSA